MKASPRFPNIFWKMMSRMNRLMLSNYGGKNKAAGRVLVLTTVGRKSGKLRMTPLQYEVIDGVYYVASARGVQADWVKNLIECPTVDIKVGEKSFSTQAELMNDPAQIADFLELRLERHPRFMGAMLRMEGLPRKHTRGDLEKLAEQLAIVRLTVDS